MDELEISGRRYLSSRRAAKEHNYHSDYIGQLIRGGKVVGQKVGRAWYVDAESLRAYLAGEAEPEIQKGVEVTVEEKPVEPTPEKESIKPLPAVEEKTVEEDERVVKVQKTPEPLASQSTPSPIPFVRHVTVKEDTQEYFDTKKKGGLTYVEDNESLLPEIRNVATKKEQPLLHKTSYGVPSQNKKERRVVRSVVQTGAYVIVGLLSLGIATGASYFFEYHSTVVEGERSTATIIFSGF